MQGYERRLNALSGDWILVLTGQVKSNTHHIRDYQGLRLLDWA